MSDRPIRVLRLLEYTYPSVEAMEADRKFWQVQGVYRPRMGHLIKSAVLPLEVLPEEEPPTLVEPGVKTHPYRQSDYSIGDACTEMVMRDDGGDQCGLPRANRVHNTSTLTQCKCGLVTPNTRPPYPPPAEHAEGCPIHAFAPKGPTE